MGQHIIQRDFELAQAMFPKLKGHWDHECSSWIIKGELDVFDDNGVYWDSFKIALVVPEGYPYCVPVVMELSNKIPRQIDWHINQEGVCCVGMDHRLLWQAKRGIDLAGFIQNEIYPYFVNQLYKLATGRYASGEYEHDFAGVRQFYTEDLELIDTNLVISILKGILRNEIPGRNAPCFCKNQKFKRCVAHYQSVNFLASIERDRLKKDLQGFLEHQTTVNKD